MTTYTHYTPDPSSHFNKASLLAQANNTEELLKTLCHTAPQLISGVKISMVFLSKHEGKEIFELKAIKTPYQKKNGFHHGKLNELILKSASKNEAIDFELSQYVDEKKLAPLSLNKISGLAIPFSAPKSNQRAVFILGYNIDQPLRQETRRTLNELLNFSGILIDALNRNEKLKELATFDHLTGLLNRRAISEIMEREHGHAERHTRRYSVLFLDIDNFKMINDMHGHNIGDDALKEIALSASDLLREGDWIGRWGGEEFICILPDTCEKGAENIATRLCQKITDIQLVTRSQRVSLTLSIGIASYPIDGTDIRTLLKHADESLLHAKDCGKNCVKRKISHSHRLNHTR